MHNIHSTSSANTMYLAIQCHPDYDIIDLQCIHFHGRGGGGVIIAHWLRYNSFLSDISSSY